MNYKKLILVGFISAFVALLTSIMGVAGTIIGSVITSVLYNMLTEALEDPVNKTSFNANFEWDIAYIFPLVVIALIQLLLIFALLSELGFLPSAFLNVYISLQHIADDNLYRLLGIALLVISIYPVLLKPEFVKKEHGAIIAFVGLIFLARGFVDMGNRITDIYDDVFINFDLPIAIVAFILLAAVIYLILASARKADKESNAVKAAAANGTVNPNVRKINPPQRHDATNPVRDKRHLPQSESPKGVKNPATRSRISRNTDFKNNTDKPNVGINRSSDKIHFESNDILDEYKK